MWCDNGNCRVWRGGLCGGADSRNTERPRHECQWSRPITQHNKNPSNPERATRWYSRELEAKYEELKINKKNSGNLKRECYSHWTKLSLGLDSIYSWEANTCVSLFLWSTSHLHVDLIFYVIENSGNLKSLSSSIFIQLHSESSLRFLKKSTVYWKFLFVLVAVMSCVPQAVSALPVVIIFVWRWVLDLGYVVLTMVPI